MSRAVPREVKERLEAWVDASCREHGRLSLDLLQAIQAPAANDDGRYRDPDLQRVLSRMAATGRWKEARVILVEFAMRECSESLKLHRLSRMGISVSRTAYYTYLSTGLAYIEGALELQKLEAESG